MARKNVLKPVLLTPTPQSLAVAYTSPVTTITFADNIAYQINTTTSDSTGSFVVEGSLDYEVDFVTGALRNPGNWAALDLGGTPVVAAANDVILINLNQLPFNAMRLRYVPIIPGTGTINVYIMTKEIGG